MIRNYRKKLSLCSLNNPEKKNIQIALWIIFFPYFFPFSIRKYGDKPFIQHNDTHRQQYIAYINEHFRTITLAQVAKYFSVSIAHCSRLIKALTGKHFTDLVRDIHLRHAKSLLKSSNMKIYDISHSLGYENQETFIRSFKKTVGLTPGQFRQASSLP